MDDDVRLRAVCALNMARARDEAGRHEYDGVLQDLSPEGVRRGLAALRPVGERSDDHDAAQLAAAEDALRVRFGELQLHRNVPDLHITNLDPSCYDRPYAPADDRAAARRAHIRAWPDAIDAAIEALDQLPGEVADSALGAAQGLYFFADEDQAARSALDRFVLHLRQAAGPLTPMGTGRLSRLLGAAEALPVNLSALATRADIDLEYWRERLVESCRRVDADAPVRVTVQVLLDDHPDSAGVVALAGELVEEVRHWTAERGLVPDYDGDCLVGETPPTMRWQVAMLSGAAPGEPDGPSWFRVSPPDPAWSVTRRRQWLGQYHRAGLANIAVHEVAPGHFVHGRARRCAATAVRRTLVSDGFTEGWGHYAEQLAFEEGFRARDPAYGVAVARDALLRLTRLVCVIGLHTGAMTLAEATRRFVSDAYLGDQAAEVAAGRVMRDPTTISYAWGRLVLHDLREQARQRWGGGFSLQRFHRAVLELGAPPLGLLDSVLTPVPGALKSGDRT